MSCVHASKNGQADEKMGIKEVSAPEQMTMTTQLRLSKDALEVKKKCCQQEIIAKEVSVSIGGQVYIGDVNAGRIDDKAEKWTFEAEGVKLLYQKPGLRCCGLCKQNELMKVSKGGQPAGTLALPTKQEKKKGVYLKVLNADGAMVYAVRREIKPRCPCPPCPTGCPFEMYCCCFLARYSKFDGCSFMKVSWPAAGVGCCHLFADRCSLEGHDMSICGHRCFSCLRSPNECHCIFCMNGPSVYQRDGEDQVTCQTHCCLYHRLCPSTEDCCVPKLQQAPSPAFEDFSKGNFWCRSQKCGSYCGMDLGIDTAIFNVQPTTQLVCCCFDARCGDTKAVSCDKIPCIPLCVTGCCPEPWFDTKNPRESDPTLPDDPFCCYGGVQCCGEPCSYFIPCLKDGFRFDPLSKATWHTPLPEDFEEISTVDGTLVRTDKAPEIVKDVSAGFATQQSEENLLAFSTVMIWEMVRDREMTAHLRDPNLPEGGKWAGMLPKPKLF